MLKINRPFNWKTGIAHKSYHVGWGVIQAHPLFSDIKVRPYPNNMQFLWDPMKMNNMEITADNCLLFSGFGIA